MDGEGAGGLRGPLGVSLVWATILGAVLLFTGRPAPSSVSVTPARTARPTLAPTLTPAPLRIDVAGAVLRPGVYRLPAGSIVEDAILVAGGLAPDAEPGRMNRAAALRDTMQVVVPRKGEAPAKDATPGQTRRPDPTPGLVHLNSATMDQLEALAGIGPALAQRIIEGRPYTQAEDLMRVRGISKTLFEQVRPFITVE